MVERMGYLFEVSSVEEGLCPRILDVGSIVGYLKKERGLSTPIKDIFHDVGSDNPN